MKFEQPIPLNIIAEWIGARVAGNENASATGINEIHKVEVGDLVFVDHKETKVNGSPLVVVVNLPKANVCTALYHRGFRTVAEERVIWRP